MVWRACCTVQALRFTLHPCVHLPRHINSQLQAVFVSVLLLTPKQSAGELQLHRSEADTLSSIVPELREGMRVAVVPKVCHSVPTQSTVRPRDLMHFFEPQFIIFNMHTIGLHNNDPSQECVIAR